MSPREDGAAVTAESGRRATWFELFGDLVFVAAVGQITHRIGGRPGVTSVVAAAALFVPLWWTWVLYAVRANRADRDNTAHRLLTTAGLAAVTGMAVFAGGVGHGSGADTGFVASYLCARGGVAALYAWEVSREAHLMPLLRTYLLGSAASALLWLGGLLLLDGPARYATWAVAMAAELALPLLARRQVAGARHDAEHLRERFGLFTIIVLGETVLGFTDGLVAARTAPGAAVTGAAAFALCAGLWWSYFSASGSRPGGHAELASGGRLMHVYVFGHLPVQLALALTGGAVGAAVAGSGSRLTAVSAGCVVGGVALFLVSTAVIRAAFLAARDAVVVIRLLAAAAALLLLPLAGRAPVAVVLASLAVLLAASVAVEGPAHRNRLAASGTGAA
ncbi:low temperature requirement protein A [Streptomyces sp. NPDC058231]|uniref:low temperature requirement protein A n=1 Tax=Streptomyces sp. NPDC058231 TaxID=3346392 RepID=UPI0036E9FBD3